MIINNIKTAIRNLKKRWSFALINILGLSVGLASFLILISYTTFEDSFDDFHENKENIYRIIYNSYDGKELKMTYPFVQPALGNTIKEGIEEVKLVSRFSRSNNSIVKYENVVLEENKLFYADEDFFNIFSFELLVGNSKNALKEPNSVVLTEATSFRFFGNEESVGKILKIGNNHGTHQFTVTGIVKDIPLNSSLNFDILCSFSTLNKKEWFRNSWIWTGFVTYIKVPSTSDLSIVEEKIDDFSNPHRKGTTYENRIWKYNLQPLKDVHLKSDFRVSKTSSAAQTLLLLKGIALLIIIISWVNYINLSIASSTERAKETGVRKALGAMKKQIVSQFFVEAILVNFLALLVALLLILLTLKPFLSLLELNYEYEMLLQPVFGYYLVIIFCIGTITSGIYPAFVLASFKSIEVLNSKTVASRGSVRVRSILLGLQFLISIVMITATLIMIHQTYYMKNQDLGVDINDKLIIKKPKLISNKLYISKYPVFLDELKKETNSEAVSASYSVPSAGSWNLSVWVASKGLDTQQSQIVNGVDTEYLSMYDIKFVAGRNFYKNNLLEKHHAIVSEKFLETFGFPSPESAIGEKIKIETFKGIVFEIIGVFKDYHHFSVKKELPGMIMVPNFKLFKLPNFFSIKLGKNTLLKSKIKKSEQVFKQFFPNDNFEYEILRDRYFLQYKQEDKMLNIFCVFSVLAILLACIGVVGLSSFVAFLKTREIAIRKVFGANKMTIFLVLSRDFIVVMSISFVISIPIVYYFMNHWLQNYPLRIKVSVEHFLASFLLMIVITIVIIGVNLFKAMRKPPSDVLKG